MEVLLVDPQGELPANLSQQLGRRDWHIHAIDQYDAAAEWVQQGRTDAVILPMPADPFAFPQAHQAFDRLLRAVQAQRLAAILVTDSEGVRPEGESLIDTVPPTVTVDEIRGRLATIDRFKSALCRMDRELTSMQRLGKRLNEYFAEVDEEMRLAGRLQRDFLPQDIGRIGPVTFGALFRPASWVSGDLYDIMRVDESHVAFYVVDAIGHGMSAALLTMFIKRAVCTKRVRPDGYELLDPSETLSLLNDALSGQTLPRCQFVTGCYCLLNLDTLVLRFARAGHPHPLLVNEEGVVTELHSQGGLLGVFRGEEFPTHQVQLHAGEKIIVYTDGLELAYAPERYHSDPVAYYRAIFDGAAAGPVGELIRKLNTDINDEAGSLHPRDDVTVVAMEVHRASPSGEPSFPG